MYMCVLFLGGGICVWVVYVWGGGYLPAYVCARQRSTLDVFLSCSLLTDLGTHWLGSGWWTSGLGLPPPLLCPSPAVTGRYYFFALVLHVFWGSKPWSFSFHGKQFPNWAVFPAPSEQVSYWFEYWFHKVLLVPAASWIPAFRILLCCSSSS